MIEPPWPLSEKYVGILGIDESGLLSALHDWRTKEKDSEEFLFCTDAQLSAAIGRSLSNLSWTLSTLARGSTRGSSPLFDDNDR